MTDTKSADEMVACAACAAEGKTFKAHQLAQHIAKVHGLSTQGYIGKYPGSPIISPYISRKLVEARAAAKGGTPAAAEPPPAAVSASEPKPEEPKFLFFGKAKLAIRQNLDAAEVVHVPAHDDNFQLDDNALELLALGIANRENVMMVGPTGAGKTALVRELAAIINQPVRRVNLHGDVRAADFVGEKVVEVDSESGQAIVSWQDGILPDAMKRGHWLLLDEMDATPPQIAFVLQAVLEGPSLGKGAQLVLTADGGRVVEAHPNFRIIATANTIGKGDDSGLYTGTNVLNEAFLDRFGTVIITSYLPASQEVQVLTDKTKISKTTANLMVQCAGLVRKGMEAEECYCTFSTRRLLAWATKAVALQKHDGDKAAIWRAANVAILNKLSSDDRKYVEAVIQRIVGGK